MFAENSTRPQKGRSIVDFPSDYVLIDIETTGIDPGYCDIIEVAAIKVEGDVIVDEYTSLINPGYDIDSFISELTGITNDMLKIAPKIEEILPDYRDFLGDKVLIGHNVNFDINFLYDNFINGGLGFLSNDYIDTLRHARRILSELEHHRLSDLEKYYDLSQEGSHRALADVYNTKMIFDKLKESAIEKYESIENYIRATNRKKLKAKDIIADKSEFDIEHPFYNKQIAITGTLERMTRRDAMQILADLGAICQDGVTKKTNYLILGNTDYNHVLKGKKSSKLLKAEAMKLEGKDLEILSENVFYDIIEEYEHI